jgi:cysteine desulfurase/selenocysteine lyase
MVVPRGADPADFPILATRPGGRRLVYLDNAATTQKPRAVIEAVARVYLESNASVHRGSHALSARATGLFETARATVRRFLNAGRSHEVVFTRSTTEAINLLARGLSAGWRAGDEVLLSVAEHHANLVPWQLAARERGLALRFLEVDGSGLFRLEDLPGLLGPRTRLVAVTHVSNVLGAIEPVQALIEAAHAHGVPVLLDAAQSAPHLPLDLGALEADFLAFSGHKMLAPAGVGVLAGRRDLLEALPPLLGGGSMIGQVQLEGHTLAEVPARFEAGTMNLEGVAGLAAALDYLEGLGGMARVQAHDQALMGLLLEGLAAVPGCHLFGPRDPAQVAGVVSLTLDGIHAHDAAAFLDGLGIAVRAGFHCAQPLVERLTTEGAVLRASLAPYTTAEDVTALLDGLKQLRTIFG